MQKAVIILAGLQLAVGLPQGITSGSGSHSHPAPTSPPLSSTLGPSPTGSAPQGCNLLNTDSEWPAPDVWTDALGDVEPGEDTEEADRPDYVLAAHDVQTVKAAIKFVAEHNVRLSVVDSGHDFLGRNDAPSGLSLDVSHLTGIKVLESFTPSESGAESPSDNATVIKPVPGQQAAVTFGAGMSTADINEALDSSGLFTIGAAHGSVKTAGGFGQTAGHAPFSSKYGLSADQVLEYKVVTADGDLVVANSVVNTDLFWALRGGGGGTFGVVVEATVKAHPSPQVTVANWWINATDSENPGEGIWDAMAYLHSQFPAINKQGVQGYYYLYPNAMKGMFAMTDDQGTQNVSKGIWEPILEKLSGYDGMEPAVSNYTDFPTFVEYFNAKIEGEDGCGDEGGDEGGHEHGHEHKRSLAKRHGGAEPMGITPLDSRLLGQSHLESPELAQALNDAMPQVPNGQLRGHLVGGGKVLDPDDDTAVLPAWRKAFVHLIGTGEGLVGNGEGQFNVASLRALAPEMGAYVNEASASNPDWKNDFWGANYDRLSELKSKYDPNGVFWVTPGINADEYAVVDGRVCKDPGPDDSTTAPSSDNENLATSSDDEDASPFPGTEEPCPTEPPTNSTTELPPDFNVEPDLDASQPPKTPGATLTKIKYGPYQVDAMDMIKNRPELRLELPCEDCYITALQADLEYEDGTTANVNTGAWLHHMVLSKGGSGAEDLRCPFLPLTERIYASGNERSVSRTNDVAPYGIEIGRSNSINMIYDLMNDSDKPMTVYMSMTYEWVPHDTEGYKPVKMAWLDVTGCGSSSVPAEEGQFVKTSPGWKSTVNGRLLGASGHEHNGGVNTTIFKNGDPICVSRQAYGSTPEFISPEGTASISDAEMCVDFGDVAVGDELVISAYYDGDLHPLDHSHDGDGLEPVMGISRVYIGT